VITAYALRFDDLDSTNTRPLTIRGDTTRNLAQAVHRHARGRLGSRRVDVHLDPDTLTGAIVSHGVTVGTFALDPVEEPQPVPETGGIRGGWTLTDIDRLARAVVSNNRTWWPAGDRDDLYAAAWHGIVEHLYTADSPPRRTELMEAGRQALAQDVKATMRHHGARRDSSNNGQKYAMYWEWAGRAIPSHEAGIVERLALEQILPALTAGQRAAVEALAAAGDYETAARLVGTAQAGLKSQLMKGRRRFRELWHEGETPSGHWGCDRRAGAVRGTARKGESAVSNMRRRNRSRVRAAAESAA
jgi:hypothetical protein